MATDRTAQAKGLLIQQYKKSPNLNLIIEAFGTAANALGGSIEQLANERTLDAAQGDMLDILGIILGFGRPFILANPSDTFSYKNPSDDGKGYSSLSNPNVGGKYIGVEGVNGFVREDDINYRRQLKAQIVKNSSQGTIEDVLSYIKTVYNLTVTMTVAAGYIDLTFTAFLNPNEQSFLRQNLPLPAGVRLRNITTG